MEYADCGDLLYLITGSSFVMREDHIATFCKEVCFALPHEHCFDTPCQKSDNIVLFGNGAVKICTYLLSPSASAS
jgi:serine/threonine protein kinase